MKKLLSILFIFIIVGCTMKSNTPTDEVEDLFYRYNSLDNVILTQLDTVINDNDLTDEQKEKYLDVFKRQYKDLKYDIKDIVINDDNAIATVQIEVYNLNKVKTDSQNYLDNNKDEFEDEQGVFNESIYWDYRLNEMLNTNEKINYTLELKLTKIDNTWNIDQLNDTERQKIHGVY